MVANIRGYTPNYGFKLINFDTPRWHTLEYANWSQLDSMFLQFGASGIRGEWQNATEYLIGERVFDVVNGLLYRCLVQHVSAISGSFADDRELHDDYWSLQLGGVPVFRGPWVAGNSYAIGDIVNVDYEYYLGTSNHIAVAPFPGNGPEWQTIFDATEVITDAQTAADAAELSATNAANSEGDAETAADIAVNAQSAFKWNFLNDFVVSDPLTANIKFNNVALNLANTISISANSADPNSPDVSAWVASWDDSTNTPIRGTLQIRGVSAPQNFAIFSVTSTIGDNGAWLQIPVAYVAHAGAFALEDILTVSFARAGNQGASGGGTGDMLGSSNLIECTDDAIARTNIGVGSTDDPTFSQVHVGTPTLNDHAVTLAHHNTAANLKAPLASPALTGTPTAPTAAIGTSTTQLATTAFVDAEAVAKAGDTMGGLLTLSGPPTAILHAATKKYVDDATSGVPAAQRSNILSPHEGLVISRTNNTTVQVNAEGVVLFNTIGGGKRFGTLSKALNITTTGINGRVGFTEGPNLWYYIWAIGKADGTLETMLTAVVTPPAVPPVAPGFDWAVDYYGLLGAVRNDGSSNFINFFQRGNHVTRVVQVALTGGNAANYTAVSLVSSVPAVATVVDVLLNLYEAGTSVPVAVVVPEGSGTTTTYSYLIIGGQALTGESIYLAGRLVLTTPQQLKYNTQSTAVLEITVTGWMY